MKVPDATRKAIEAAIAAGTARVVNGPAADAGDGRRAKPERVAEGFRYDGNAVEFTVPVETVSEANQRGWRGKASRAGSQRKAVAAVLGKHLRELADFADHYHAGWPLGVTITRLGGRRLDALSNLGAALKAIEDTVALVIGADDGDPRWRGRAEQEPGGEVGVRIRLSQEV